MRHGYMRGLFSLETTCLALAAAVVLALLASSPFVSDGDWFNREQTNMAAVETLVERISLSLK